MQAALPQFSLQGKDSRMRAAADPPHGAPALAQWQLGAATRVGTTAAWDKDSPRMRAHPDLSQGPADLQSAALATELCTHVSSRVWAHVCDKTSKAGHYQQWWVNEPEC